MSRITILSLAILAGFTLTATAEAQDRGQRPTFDQLDADGDGALTREELAAFREDRVAIRFGEADSDGDGRLTRAELEATADARVSRRVGRILERLDTNDDGSLDRAELEAREGRGHRGGLRNRLDGMFERADTDGDGALSAEEWDAARLARR